MVCLCVCVCVPADHGSVACEVFLKMGVTRQVLLLLWKNVTYRRRNKVRTLESINQSIDASPKRTHISLLCTGNGLT